MFVDVHTHVFHPHIAERAKLVLKNQYGLDCRCKGTAEDLLIRAQRCGIDHVVALCAATSVAQVQPLNGYACYLQNTYPAITAFGSIHPDYDDWKAELDRLRIYGVRGIKLKRKDELEEVYLFASGEDFAIVYNEKELSLSRMKLAKRDGNGIKPRG